MKGFQTVPKGSRFSVLISIARLFDFVASAFMRKIHYAMNLRNVWMLQRRERLRLRLEAHQAIGIGRQASNPERGS